MNDVDQARNASRLPPDARHVRMCSLTNVLTGSCIQASLLSRKQDVAVRGCLRVHHVAGERNIPSLGTTLNTGS